MCYHPLFVFNQLGDLEVAEIVGQRVQLKTDRVGGEGWSASL
jgi:hypothetical protein